MKRTYNLDDSLVAAVKEAVELGDAPSQDALVEKALRRELRRMRDRRHSAMWEASLSDAEFRAELKEVEQAYAQADLEGWPPY